MLYDMSVFLMDCIDEIQVNNLPINSKTVSNLLRNGNSNMLRSVANSAPIDYIEGLTFPYRFQFVTKQSSEPYAMKLCDEVVKLFHMKQKELTLKNPPFKIISSKCINLPSFSDIDDENRYTYSCLFEMELEVII